ncbi:MAG TPA: DUF6390 family protein [Acidimicrobiia bacterium]|jgi:hypothetical protein
MSDRGALLFARYAYPPNALGYCGPPDSAALLEYAAAGVCDGGLVDLAGRFEGAWPYLELIAAANGLDDPLDERVVRAYWVGNDLLRATDPSLLMGSLSERFVRRAGSSWRLVSEAVLAGGPAHHNFHVMAVYPWIGLLRAGHSGPEPLHVLDRCRIRWGRVLGVDGPTAVVRSRSLGWDGRVVTLGQPRVEQVVTSANGYSLAGELRPDDWVALHWDWVCDRLTGRELAELERATRGAMAATSPPPRRMPVPA